MAKSPRNWQDAPWSDQEPLECLRVVSETSDTATFTFRAPSGAWFDYKPGQFLTLDLPVDPGKGASGNVQRTYTMSSSPSRPQSVSVTVKAQAGSIGTRWMLDHLRPGMRIKAFGPAGSFTNHGQGADKYLFISAGSGITPMLSMLTYGVDSGLGADIAFVHAARSPADIIRRANLEAMARDLPGMQLRYVVEDAGQAGTWGGYQGRLSGEMLKLMVPDFASRTVFCCGPAPFMRAMREILASLGYDMVRYHEESFSGPEAPDPAGPAAATITLSEETAAEITFQISGITASCTPGETVLAAAKRSGLNIPSGCTFGLCGTCKIRKTAGEVALNHNGGISDDDIAEGWILACCSTPKGTVSVEV